MKLSTSTFSVVVIAVFLTICMIDFGEATCPMTCTATNKYVCGQRVNELRTFSSDCAMENENLCGSGGWTIRSRGQCPSQ